MSSFIGTVGGGNFNLFVYDPETAQGSDYTPFENGVTFNGRYTLPITINGQRGFQSIGAVYSTKEGSDLKSAPILGELPPGVSTVIKGRGAWLVTYAFQQFLYQDPHNPAQNWGIFGDFIVTDGNPSPIKWRALVGIAGTAESPGRGLDRWGIGYFHYGFSNALAKNLASQGLRIRDENGVELFYNFAIAPQFRLKTDLQIVNPVFSAADLAVYGGVQVELKF